MTRLTLNLIFIKLYRCAYLNKLNCLARPLAYKGQMTELCCWQKSVTKDYDLRLIICWSYLTKWSSLMCLCLCVLTLIRTNIINATVNVFICYVRILSFGLIYWIFVVFYTFTIISRRFICVKILGIGIIIGK